MLLTERKAERAYSIPAGRMARTGRTSRPFEKKRFDVLSPPVLVGATYLGLFGMTALDILLMVTDGRPRLRSEFRLYTGLSVPALIYLAAGYLLFVAGYYVKAGRLIAGLFPIRSGHLRPSRIPILTVVMFTVTFAVLVAYTYIEGYGRRIGTSEAGTASFLENLVLLGEMSWIPVSLGFYYYWLARKNLQDRRAIREAARPQISKGFSFFVWKVMLPLQIAVGIWTGTRSRVIQVIIIALAAYHYTYRRLRVSTLARYGVLMIALVPMLGTVRDSMFSNATSWESRLSAQGVWDSFMERSSALEGFTIAFENPDSTPPPDALWLTVVSGTIPRFLWPNKPNATFSHDFSVWLTGDKLAVGYGPALPGELMLSFGYPGGLMAMFALGVLWRVLYEATIGSGLGTGSGFIYFSLLPTLLSVETGFVIQYSVVLRFVLVGLLVYWLASAKIAARSDHPRRSVGALEFPG
jgi:hypothetical protein